MSKVVQFRTDSVIPLEAFQIMGVNVKHSNNAIGRFGTGLKYAVAVILRHGGRMRLFREGVEYEFYLSKRDFRGKTFQQVRMRKRDGLVGRWLSSTPLPFTTELGKDWKLWQAYRELESNTRDENGETYIYDVEGVNIPPSGTIIEVISEDFYDSTQVEDVFFSPAGDCEAVYSDDFVDIYDAPSKYFYYQGIRVYDLRYPARFTYNFKAPHVQLTEDRTAANSWYLMYYLGQIVQDKVLNGEILKKMLQVSGEEGQSQLSFETQDLNFDICQSTSETFKQAARDLHLQGMASRGVNQYYLAYSAPPPSLDVAVELPKEDWENILEVLTRNFNSSYPTEQNAIANFEVALYAQI